MKIFRVVAVCLLLFLISAPAMAETELKLPAKDPQADYDRVWDAAIDALYGSRIPIAYMSKADGYLVTDKKVLKIERDYSRVQVTIRFIKKDGSIIVSISTDAEEIVWYRPLIRDFPPFYFWNPAGSNEGLENALKEKITSRL